ncbi:DUF4270 domain-containing protein [Xanthomarina spongicola]|uniref:Uncharacterized protein DUF4270 n=1 Tax=Xanthomarina spongicola TaxID=570520 RepID=A0A316DQU5_9FLAO|nr:DUF4270 domain-containing protein [Xanthomarina spongicola]PWK20384.1 uncharacterized protein DUF4270 [Xanthomarina spongicola]
MKRKIEAFKYLGVLAFVLFTFFACENDYNSLESDIQGIENFYTDSDVFPIVAYNKKLNPVQTNGLPSSFLGVYTDPIYGQTVTNIITQAFPSSSSGYDPDFGINPEFKQAYLTIPYYSEEISDEIYKLDSLYGDSPVKLTIYRTNYFLRDYSPDTDDLVAQLYYSNNHDYDNYLGEILYEEDEFYPSNSYQIIEEEDEDGQLEEVDRIAPALRVPLLNPGGNFWESLLFDKQGMPELSNANNFKDYFRGLYFKVEPVNGEGNTIMLNFLSSVANLTVYYNNEDEDGEIVRNNKFIMGFRGNRANAIYNDPTNTVIDDADNNADVVNGDQNLYLKGGEGSIAVVNLFEDPDVLEEFKLLYKDNDGNPSRLINEANLIFYVDQAATINNLEDQEPNRVILYDMKNNIPIVDFFFDLTTNTVDPINSKLNYSSILERDASGKGVKYKIRLTEHMNNILLKDSTNFELGLYLTTNINEISNSDVLNLEKPEGLPMGTVLSPKGTVLHGSNLNVPENKRVQLEIYYTEPDN